MKRLYRVVGAVVALVLLVYFAYFVRNSFEWEALQRLAAPTVIGAMVLAAALYGLIIPLSARAWKALLVQSSSNLSLRMLCGIMAATQLAKYLPGNILQHASRAALSMAHGMGFRDFSASVITETLLATLAGLLVGLACLAATPAEVIMLPSELTAILPWLVGGLVAMLLAMPLLVGAIDAVSRSTRWSRHVTPWRQAMPSHGSQAVAFTIYCANYLLIGLGFIAVAKAVGIDAEFGYTHLTSAFALSWLAGFLVPGMPAGIGVREGVMALMLSGVGDQSQVFSAIVAMRMATVAGDLGWFAIGSWLLVRYRGKTKL